MRPFSSSIWTKPILPNKPVQPILTAAIQLPRFSSFSPVVSQSISTIDWMKNLLTSLNLLLMKRGKRRGVRQPASKLTHKKMERVETPGKKKEIQKLLGNAYRDTIWKFFCQFLHPIACFDLRMLPASLLSALFLFLYGGLAIVPSICPSVSFNLSVRLDAHETETAH